MNESFDMRLKIKTYLLCSFAVLAIALFAGGAEAKVTGNCSDCHTMHNSQGGTAMATQLNSTYTAFQKDGTPNPMLLTTDCVGCHTYTDSTTTITTTNNTPIVFNTGGYPLSGALAGGNFYGVSGDNSTKHNVAGLTTAQSLAPPGFIPNISPNPAGSAYAGVQWGPLSWSVGTQVTCGGTNGCHGDRRTGNDDYKAVRGAHHANNMAVAKDGSTVAKSYRFLAGIMGSELSNYEQSVTSTSHNAYYGLTGSKQTISYFCGECHGNFHGASNLGGATGQVGTQSPWLRHPTDVALVASGGSPFTTNYTTYDPVIPVAFNSNNTVNTTTSAVTNGNIIMCLSCHRAHGSKYYKLMRWNIKGTTLLSSPTPNPDTDAIYGCSKCHKGKD